FQWRPKYRATRCACAPPTAWKPPTATNSPAAVSTAADIALCSVPGTGRVQPVPFHSSRPPSPTASRLPLLRVVSDTTSTGTLPVPTRDQLAPSQRATLDTLVAPDVVNWPPA